MRRPVIAAIALAVCAAIPIAAVAARSQKPAATPMMHMRHAMPGMATSSAALPKGLASGPAVAAAGKQIGTTDVNAITGSDTHPYVSQAGDQIWAHGSTVVVAYNDTNSVSTLSNLSGISYS